MVDSGCGTPPRDHARVTYDLLAAHYDAFTAHHDYDDWTATVERLARAHGLRGHRLLDVACGTGKSFLPFLGRGYAVTAFDVSPNMVRVARGKAATVVAAVATTGGPVLELPAFHVADLRALSRLGAFDLVTCLDDVVNHLATPEELAAAFEGIGRNLASDGVAVFDVNTLHAYRTAFSALHVVPGGERVVVCDGGEAADLEEGGSATAVFEVFERAGDGSWRRERAVHHQHHHPRATIEAALRVAGLRMEAAYGMGWDGSTGEDVDEHASSKVLYIARHEALARRDALEEGRR